MEKEQVERINALARKKKAEGLTEEETAEHEALRKQYIAELREHLKATLDQVYLEQEDGTWKKLGKKPGKA